MKTKLAAVEREYVDFWADRRGVEVKAVETAYLDARHEFGFEGKNYHNLALSLYRLFAVAYGAESEADLVAAHRHYSVLHALKLVMRETRDPAQYDKVAADLVPLLPANPVVVDYGAGIGSTSLALAAVCPSATFYFVDVPSTMSDFALYRALRRGLKVTPVPVTVDDPYPTLPRCDVALVDLVLEELLNPERAYLSITRKLKVGGLLVGRFSDWRPQLLRPSPDLSVIRTAVERDYTPLGDRYYRKNGRQR